MNYAKKTISVLVVCGLIMVSAAGCGKSTSSNSSDSSQASSGETSATSAADSNFNAEGLPIVNEPVTLDVITVRWGSMGDSFTANQWLKDLETSTNVKINWQIQSSNDWTEQKAILLASGSLPDVILGSETMKDTDIINNLSYFLPLDEYIDQYMPNLKAALDETPAMKKIVTVDDGHIYSLPRRLPGRPQSNWQPLINQTWLDNLGLKAPTNLDELYTVLKAFKDEDANGNGDPNDEIPITAKEFNMNWLMPFQCTVSGERPVTNNVDMIMEDGKPVFYFTMDSYKEGLKYYSKLYQEGIMDQENFTQDDTMLTAKRQNPDVALVGFDYQWVPDAVMGKWGDQYVAIPPIEGYNGKYYCSGDENGVGAIGRNEMEITTFCETPEVAARWADQFYNDEATIQNFWGAIGTVISKNTDGTYSLNDPPEGTTGDAWYWDQSLRDFGPKYVSPDFDKKLVFDPTSGDGLKLEIDKMQTGKITPPFPKVMYTADELEQIAALATDIDEFIRTSRAQWITKGGVDEGWDAYVQKLDDMGLQDIIKIRLAAFDRYNKE